jgi:hypothetical protein
MYISFSRVETLARLYTKSIATSDTSEKEIYWLTANNVWPEVPDEREVRTIQERVCAIQCEAVVHASYVSLHCTIKTVGSVLQEAEIVGRGRGLITNHTSPVMGDTKTELIFISKNNFSGHL